MAIFSDIEIVTFTGRSGVGKNSIVERLMSQFSLPLVLSTTTRRPRSSDLPGEYSYITKEAFLKIKKEEFAWTVMPHGEEFYGTLKVHIDNAWKADHVSMMIITHSAVMELWKYSGGSGVLPFFVDAPEECLLQRLKKRGDTDESAQRRMLSSRDWRESALGSGIPYIEVLNEDGKLDIAVKEITNYLERYTR